LWTEWLVYLAQVARGQELPAADAAFWSSLSTTATVSEFVTAPDFYGCEMQVVAWGRNPGPVPA
jgi:hypothetical protein